MVEIAPQQTPEVLRQQFQPSLLATERLLYQSRLGGVAVSIELVIAMQHDAVENLHGFTLGEKRNGLNLLRSLGVSRAQVFFSAGRAGRVEESRAEIHQRLFENPGIECLLAVQMVVPTGGGLAEIAASMMDEEPADDSAPDAIRQTSPPGPHPDADGEFGASVSAA